MPPTSRPQRKRTGIDAHFLIWTGVAALVLVSLFTVALGVTSTRWFCAEGCHEVEAEAVASHQRSTHSEVSCMACHMEVGANPLAFVLHKAESLGGIYLTVTEDSDVPLNQDSTVALTMASDQCTQCHNLAKRKVTPTRGILIDHAKHDKAKVTCAVCHNRIGHKEDFALSLTGSHVNQQYLLHPDFMKMAACFRCHSQTAPPKGGLKAPGACDKCHTSLQDLKPATHKKRGFFPEGHGDLAKEEASRVVSFEVEADNQAEKAQAEGTADPVVDPSDPHGIGSTLVKVGEINQCTMCHAEKFCTDCHGLPVPHPVDFKDNHAKIGRSKPKVCANCHGTKKQFCDECHHGTAMNWKYRRSTPWRKQHPSAVQQVGASACFDCHGPTYCAQCHIKGRAQ